LNNNKQINHKIAQMNEDKIMSIIVNFDDFVNQYSKMDLLIKKELITKNVFAASNSGGVKLLL